MSAGAGDDELSSLLRPCQVPIRRAGRRRTLRHEQVVMTENGCRGELQQSTPSFRSKKPPVNDYPSIDFLPDLVQDLGWAGQLRPTRSLREISVDFLDQISIALLPAIIGALTAGVAFLVDVAEPTVSDWKYGYCVGRPFLTREACCRERNTAGEVLSRGAQCEEFQPWSKAFGTSFVIYLSLALAYGLTSSCVTLFTKHTFKTMAPDTATTRDADSNSKEVPRHQNQKTMYMASGSGIPELRTILGGFDIPNFLTFKVMSVKAVGAVFAVATGMCLGKEGPFVHISACIGNLVAQLLPHYRSPQRLREILSASCAAGLSVAFGAPIGGVLFAYEEISTYFPRKVLWKAFLCSLTAALVLRELNPNGTGQLVLFETQYKVTYSASLYLLFVMLGITGGVFGAIFCKLNFVWSQWFRSFRIINRHPTLETAMVVLFTVLLQYPNPLARESGDAIIRSLLVDCRHAGSETSLVCQSEAQDNRLVYYCYLVAGCLTKLILTIVTFGIKVPSGVIIPFLGAGAYFGRFVGQAVPEIPPGVFAMVGAGAFLAGVSRMTVSLGVIMLELTGELEYVVPNMVAILVAKWVADVLCPGGVYELAQILQGHPFLDYEHSIQNVQGFGSIACEIIEPGVMQHIALAVPDSNKISQHILVDKLKELKALGLMNMGLVLVNNDCQPRGHLDGAELDAGLQAMDDHRSENDEARLFKTAGDSRVGKDLSRLVDRSPVTVLATTPLEHVIYMFGQLGVRRLIVIEDGTGRTLGIIDKWRLIVYLDERRRQ